MSDYKPERGSEAWQQQVAEERSIERGSEAWQERRRRVREDRPWYFKKRIIIPTATAGLLILLGLTSSPQRKGVNEPETTYAISSAGLDTAERSMSFEECSQQIRTMAGQIGTPSNLVDTTAMRVVRFPASDGSVLVTCDAIGEKMIIVKSPAPD